MVCILESLNVRSPLLRVLIFHLRVLLSELFAPVSSLFLIGLVFTLGGLLFKKLLKNNVLDSRLLIYVSYDILFQQIVCLFSLLGTFAEYVFNFCLFF